MGFHILFIEINLFSLKQNLSKTENVEDKNIINK